MRFSTVLWFFEIRCRHVSLYAATWIDGPIRTWVLMYTHIVHQHLCLWLEYSSGIEGIKRSAARWQSAYLRLLSCNHRRAPSSVAFITLKASSSTFFWCYTYQFISTFFLCVCKLLDAILWQTARDVFDASFNHCTTTTRACCQCAAAIG